MIRNYEKGGAIGTPSTFSINWRASYNVGDKVRIRIDMVDKNIDYNSDDNVFTIVKIEKGGATPFKLDSKGNSIGGFIRDENPSGFLYILDKNGGSWEGKDLEPYLEVIQPQTTTTIVEKTKVSNNSNKEEIQLLVDNFITSNATEIQRISQDNPLLFDSVTNILSFISTKLGTREGAIEIPKVEIKPVPLSTQTTSTASTTTPQKTTKKAKKVLTQEEKDRIEEIKLEIEGLEIIADDDDDAKEEIQKLKNELKQIKNS